MVSVFFEEKDLNKNGLDANQVFKHVPLYIRNNAKFAAFRMDLIKFAINENIKIVRWVCDEESAIKLKLGKDSRMRIGMGIEFKTSDTHKTFTRLARKIRGDNKLKLSAHELVYLSDRDVIYISFKKNVEFESQHVGLFENSKIKWINRKEKLCTK